MIGTPLTKGATRVMLLGSGELGKEVAIALQRYGVEVIAVDRYANAPAQQVAHRHHVIDMTCADQLKHLIDQESPHFVIPEIEAIATSVLLELETRGLTTIIPNARAVQLTMNREGIRKLAAEQLGLPTSPYFFAESLEELEQAAEKLGYPCFIKPIMSSSGKGQSLLRNPSDLEPAWHHAQEGGRVKNLRVIVEGKINFDYEITLLTVRAVNKEGSIETLFCEPIGHVQQQGDYVESWQPQAMTQTASNEACRIAKAITDNLGGQGLFGVELFVQGDKVWFSEVSPRPHDTGLVTLVTQEQNEFELHARAILGFPVSTKLQSPGASAVIYGNMEAQGIGFDGLDKALAITGTEVRLFGKPEAHPRRRMGVALATGENLEQGRERAKTAATLIVPVRLDK